MPSRILFCAHFCQFLSYSNSANPPDTSSPASNVTDAKQHPTIYNPWIRWAVFNYVLWALMENKTDSLDILLYNQVVRQTSRSAPPAEQMVPSGSVGFPIALGSCYHLAPCPGSMFALSVVRIEYFEYGMFEWICISNEKDFWRGKFPPTVEGMSRHDISMHLPHLLNLHFCVTQRVRRSTITR